MRQSAEPLSLFVVHWNRPRECAATVRAFLGQGVPLKVTVIDNDSESEACERLRVETGSLAEVLRLSENKGWGPAINVALRNWLESASSSYCLISAHDASPSPDCVPMLVDMMDSDPRIGIACPQYPDESVPHFSSIRGVQLAHGRALARGAAQSIDVPHGTLMIVRRECLNEIGIFDERYFAYGDEHELGARAVRRGWKVVMVWGALVTNPGTTTPSAWRSYLFGRNSLLLVHDYFGSIAATVRAFLLLANTARLSFARNPEIAFSAKARFRAVSDYFMGRFGPPPFR
jgi:N-acetylglucosaminyl-diphospho-decaprenol L-rhamnosyltransferase